MNSSVSVFMYAPFTCGTCNIFTLAHSICNHNLQLLTKILKFTFSLCISLKSVIFTELRVAAIKETESHAEEFQGAFGLRVHAAAHISSLLGTPLVQLILLFSSAARQNMSIVCEKLKVSLRDI